MPDGQQELRRDTLTNLPTVVCVAGGQWMKNVTLISIWISFTSGWGQSPQTHFAMFFNLILTD